MYRWFTYKLLVPLQINILIFIISSSIHSASYPYTYCCFRSVQNLLHHISCIQCNWLMLLEAVKSDGNVVWGRITEFFTLVVMFLIHSWLKFMGNFALVMLIICRWTTRQSWSMLRQKRATGNSLGLFLCSQCVFMFVHTFYFQHSFVLLIIHIYSWQSYYTFFDVIKLGALLFMVICSFDSNNSNLWRDPL